MKLSHLKLPKLSLHTTHSYPPVLLTGKHSSAINGQNQSMGNPQVWFMAQTVHVTSYIVFPAVSNESKTSIDNLDHPARHTWSFTLLFTLIGTDTTGRFSLTVPWVKLQHELTLFSLILQLWKLSYSHLATLPPLSPLDHKEAVKLKIWKRPTTTPKPLQ